VVVVPGTKYRIARPQVVIIQLVSLDVLISWVENIQVHAGERGEVDEGGIM
jgi:hypothetical protein